MYLSVLEGVCYEMRLNQQRLKDCGITLSPLKAAGGGAQSKVWMQMKSNILRLPITRMETKEAGSTGSAMLVGLALNLFGNLKEAGESMIHERETYYPDAASAVLYDEVFNKYERLYDAIRPLV